MGEENGQRTPGLKERDGRGWDGQHRDDHAAATPDNGQRTRRGEGVNVGQASGHDIQDSVRKPECGLDTSTEDRDHDLDDV